MTYQQRDNSGALFRNDQKQKESQPDYRGTIRVGGKDYWLSGWAKSSQKGNFISLALNQKDKKEEQPAPEQGDNQDNDNPNLPF